MYGNLSYKVLAMLQSWLEVLEQVQQENFSMVRWGNVLSKSTLEIDRRLLGRCYTKAIFKDGCVKWEKSKFGYFQPGIIFRVVLQKSFLHILQNSVK